ncbi:lipoprotein NlpD [Sphingomonas sp. SORGH_AS 950]|uniref:M23 family metallopeptidase n=1 Tax=Sphingomonas sp. SORGH_AS_0950 TaxID=3041792 RepID=UPI00277EFC2A|nr:M23 family metallopeptidase [Sphingomonas sp. SORGH_AS_0950]MDQ1156617.1 lipoprotein NlpD [Sphingomonas sp. SORGH_AS_0950]
MRLSGGVVGIGLLLSGCIPNMEPPVGPAPPVAQPAAQPTAPPPSVEARPLPPRQPVPVRPTATVPPHATGTRPPIRRSVPVRPAPRPPVASTPVRPVPTPVQVQAHAPSPPAPRPSWELHPVTPDAQVIEGSTYIVKPGDTLRVVGDRTGAGTEAIARANGLPPPYVIRTGQKLIIPAGRFHLVRPGESGIAIARAYGVPWSRIVEANAFAEPYVLRAGQRILIPGNPVSAPLSSAAERAAAFTLDVDDILTGGEPALASNQAPARPSPTPRRVLPPTAVVAAPARLSSGFAWPVEGRVVKRFGAGPSGERNDGIKIAVPAGTPIKATADGVVAYVGDGIAALGGLVIVKHGGGWTSVYGHASKLLVQRGQSVKRGQTLALSGQSGFAERPELHFELRRGRTPVDPLSQLPGR